MSKEHPMRVKEAMVAGLAFATILNQETGERVRWDEGRARWINASSASQWINASSASHMEMADVFWNCDDRYEIAPGPEPEPEPEPEPATRYVEQETFLSDGSWWVRAPSGNRWDIGHVLRLDAAAFFRYRRDGVTFDTTDPRAVWNPKISSLCYVAGETALMLSDGCELMAPTHVVFRVEGDT